MKKLLRFLKFLIFVPHKLFLHPHKYRRSAISDFLLLHQYNTQPVPYNFQVDPRCRWKLCNKRQLAKDRLRHSALRESDSQLFSLLFFLPAFAFPTSLSFNFVPFIISTVTVPSVSMMIFDTTFTI